MANLTVFLLFFTLFILSSAARVITDSHLSSSSSPSAYYVCSAERFTGLGLNASWFTFCDKSQPFHVRAKDLVDSMTLEEKVAQLGDQAKGVSRLGIPPYQWWSEALHGVSNVGRGATFFNGTIPGATSFPTPIVLAASFNESLWKRLGQTVSTEARAMHNEGMSGLTFWSPNINVVRDPRWGRALETPGEDPFVVGRYAVNYVRGLQDVEGHENPHDLNSRPLKVSACCKHYVAYDVDAWFGIERYSFDARVTEQDMVETFQRPFEMCVKEGDVSSVMCSYNRVNGIPACADPRLQLQTIRGDWNLHGYIVSDCDSVQVMVDNHKWLGDSPEDAVAQTLKAGLDLDCGTYYPDFGISALNQGKIRETDVDNALINLYTVLLRLGYFDGSSFDTLTKEHVCTKENIELALDAARQGIVLLKNDKTLPLNPKNIKNLAAVGPHANATEVMIGNYAGIPCRYIAPKDALAEDVAVKYALGCGDAKCPNTTFIKQAVEVAKAADVTIIFAGLDLQIEAESLDRTEISLPGYQTQLINDIASNVKTPVVLVIMSAGGVDISFARDNPKINAIIWAGYPGEEGGAAIADVIFGRYNPAGRLPLTWYYADYVDKLPLTSMQLRPDDKAGFPGRTYKFFNGSVVYPFGYGLSYTQFKTTLVESQRNITTQLRSLQHCHNLNITDNTAPPCPSVAVNDLEGTKMKPVHFEVQVQNVGPVDGIHVLIIYAIPPANYIGLPLKQVVAFERVFVKAGKAKKVKFHLEAAKSLSVVSPTAVVVLPSGQHTVMVGDGEDAVKIPVDVGFYY